MHVSSGRPHMLTSNQRGRGNDPVVVLGRIRSAVAVNMAFAPEIFYLAADIALHICFYAENFLGVQAAQPKVLFEWARDYSIRTVGEFYDNQRVERLRSQILGHSAVINVTVF